MNNLLWIEILDMSCPQSLQSSAKMLALQSIGSCLFVQWSNMLNRKTCKINEHCLLKKNIRGASYSSLPLLTITEFILPVSLCFLLLNELCSRKLIFCQYYFGLMTRGVCVSIKCAARTCPPFSALSIKWLSVGLQNCFVTLL